MKNIVTIMILFSLISCGSTKLIKETEKSLDGEWTLTEVSYPDSSGFFDVTLFQTADAKCFETSVWEFVSNNHRGNVELFDANCTTETQNIVWSIENSSLTGYDYNVTLKMAENEKARKEKQGSKLQIKQLGENEMVWDLNVKFQSKPMIVRLNFVRN